MTITIPKTNKDLTVSPCWIPRVDEDGLVYRPFIRCQCGQVTSIGNHHVHKDGRVTASYLHTQGGGCGWHVHLILADYNGPEFKPGDLDGKNIKG